MSTLLILLSMWTVPLIIGLLFFVIIHFLTRKLDQPSNALEVTLDEVSSTNLPVNIAAMWSYFFGVFGGVTFFLLERKSWFVSFHAAQSLLVFGGLMVIGVLSDIDPTLGFYLGASSTTLGWFLWMYLIVMAYKGKVIVMPLVGGVACNISKKKIKS